MKSDKTQDLAAEDLAYQALDEENLLQLAEEQAAEQVRKPAKISRERRREVRKQVYLFAAAMIDDSSDCSFVADLAEDSPERALFDQLRNDLQDWLYGQSKK